MNNIQLYQGDCLEKMEGIQDGIVDLVLSDPPYGTVKGLMLDGWKNKNTSWDERIDTEKLFQHYNRILRENGVVILFSQEPYTSELRTFKHPNLNFVYPLIWKKNVHANPFNARRAPVSIYEDLTVFRKKYDDLHLNELRKYFKELLEYLGFTSLKQINTTLGHRKAEHTFYVDTLQFKLCKEEVYNELIEKLQIKRYKNFKEYEELEALNKKYQITFNIPKGSKSVSNVFEHSKEYKTYHPTQKPQSLLKEIIGIYTNELDTVLDNTMGGGSTGVACKEMNRNFIGIELDIHYFNIAKERIDEVEE